MLSQREIGLGEPLKEAVIEHGLSAHERRHVDVGPAGMHHADLRAARIWHLHLRGAWQPGLLRDRQAVERGLRPLGPTRKDW